MEMSKILDKGIASEIGKDVIEALLEQGYDPREIIPGLIYAISLLVEMTPNPEQAIDEAVDFLDNLGDGSEQPQQGLNPDTPEGVEIDDEVLEEGDYNLWADPAYGIDRRRGDGPVYD